MCFDLRTRGYAHQALMGQVKGKLICVCENKDRWGNAGGRWKERGRPFIPFGTHAFDWTTHVVTATLCVGPIHIWAWHSLHTSLWHSGL